MKSTPWMKRQSKALLLKSDFVGWIVGRGEYALQARRDMFVLQNKRDIFAFQAKVICALRVICLRASEALHFVRICTVGRCLGAAVYARL